MITATASNRSVASERARRNDSREESTDTGSGASDSASCPGAAPEIAILGAGIAAAAVARALRRHGIAPRVFAFASGQIASHIPAALLMPRLCGPSVGASLLHAHAFLHAIAAIEAEAPDAILARGVSFQLKRDEVERATQTIASGLYPEGTLRLEGAGDRLEIDRALVVAPERLLRSWLPDSTERRITAIARREDNGSDGDGAGAGWFLDEFGPFQAVVVAAGFGSARLLGLPLRPVRGQVTMAPLAAPLAMKGRAQCWGGYLIPTATGLLFGATHQRGDEDGRIRAEDEQINVAQLRAHRPDIAAAIAGLPLASFAAVRAATGYNQPIAGELAPGLFALTALGGRGFTLAPLLGAYVAARLLGAASPLAPEESAIVERPELARRFQKRAALSAPAAASAAAARRSARR